VRKRPDEAERSPLKLSALNISIGNAIPNLMRARKSYIRT